MAPEKRFSYIVDGPESALRLDHFLSGQISDLSRSYLQKLIGDGRVAVNGQPERSSYRLSAGDLIEITIPAPVDTHLIPEAIPLEVVYEDASLIVINKAAGMVVHPGAGVHTGTMVHALLHHCNDLSGVGGRLRPGIVHRLDKNTSGLLVAAKSDLAHRHLQNQFATKRAHREYKALVWGHFDTDSGIIEGNLNRSKSDRKKFAVAEKGKHAITEYVVERTFPFLSLLKIKLQTGRTHQIRVHLNSIHHPVFGDPQYSGRDRQTKRISSLSQKKLAVYLLGQIQRQALHAFTLGFEHPDNGQWLSFSAECPEDFKRIIETLNKEEGLS